MNAQHKLCKIGNRLRRIARRLTELNADKAHEIMASERNKREPNLGDISAAINRLENRARELAV